MHRRRSEVRRNIRQRRRLQRREAAEREERHVCDTVRGERVDERVVVTMRDVVLILHADDLGHLAALLDLRGGDVAEPDMPDEALLLQLHERAEGRLDRSLARALAAAHASQVDDVERIDAEMTQIVVHGERQFGRLQRGLPRRVRAAHGADLRHDHEIVRIRMQRFANDLVGNVRAVEVARIDVIDPARDRFSQDGDRRGPVFRRPEDAFAGELHRAVTEPVDAPPSERKRAGETSVRVVRCIAHGTVVPVRPRSDATNAAAKRFLPLFSSGCRSAPLERSDEAAFLRRGGFRRGRRQRRLARNS